ncbi:G-type lectin S-receptor-like serine/threonine-protein kinase LECRK3 isoform X2 [Hevea brasiliensis]|uniref:G-type lectin S-receptor-like serine/threonine-protein kinase LECRK3 isoform X2 n=1 Tax=Hevea brasiliensis TaxID=3981 RepID=UPI0025FCE5CE|nr:G-type lectin S-receptor-like serine/threonine-protein kinase LECRK3 isoform X2 [Hevea brasiliensis]
MLCKVPLALFFLLGTALIFPSYEQDTAQDYLDAHNQARADVGVGPLIWDDKVAAYAQNYANQRISDCVLLRSGGPYGENMAWGSGNLSGTDAVKMWVDEKAYYNYSINSCGPDQQCGHYTQVVWHDSVRLGCAKVTCESGGTFIVCNYDPPGNIIGCRYIGNCSNYNFNAAQQSNISLGSSLSPAGSNSSWLSHSGRFAFGFFSQGNGFGIGTWFAGIPQKTVTWTANRDGPPISRNATLALTSDGRLVLQVIRGQAISIWNASMRASYASILDSGNFVLYDADSRIIWQSFDHQTDTLLPGQLLRSGNELVSSISESNHSTGDNATLTLSENGLLYMLNRSGVNAKNITNGGNPADGKTYRLTIDADGIVRLYSHNMDQNGNWSIEWSVPNDRCDPKGVCGINAYCILLDEEPVCNCPQGFVYIDQKQKNMGCNRNFLVENCLFNNENTKYTIYELENIVWEDNAYSVLSSAAKEDCNRACLMDCNCEAALFQDQMCKKQKLPLRFGKRDLDGVSTVALMKVGDGGLTTIPTESKQPSTGILIGGVACLTFSFLVLATSGVLIFRHRASEYKATHNEPDTELASDVTLRSFTYEELERATNGFNERLGRGAFGTVFKGALSNGQTAIAVKRLEKMESEGEPEFLNEMRSIGRTHHRNLVRLLGYCHDKTNRLLVYEYMRNGSLTQFLIKSGTKPSWGDRIRIALEIARGILYLHEECEAQIIHCDINPNNILMDEHMHAKISDFGLAKLLMPDQSRTITDIMRGTRGYVAPEWHKNQPITVKADVYSFGIVFLEIMCCRRNVAANVPENEAILVDWVSSCFEENELHKLVSAEEVDEQTFQRMVCIGLWCIQEDPSVRPSMKKVVLMLEGFAEIPIPPSPASGSNTFYRPTVHVP